MTDRIVKIHQVEIISISTVLLVLGIGSYCLRLYARYISAARLWYDDYFMGAGLLVGCTPPVCNLISVHFGLGEHLIPVLEHSLGEAFTFLKLMFAIMSSWLLAMVLIKTAMLLLLWRLFPDRKFQVAIYSVAAFVGVCFLSLFIALLLQCRPLSAFWNPTTTAGCFDLYRFYVASAAINLASDMVVLALPMPMVWSLQLSFRRKIALSFVFLVGGFVCIIGVLRLIAMKDIDFNDVTWSLVAPTLWTSAEVQMSVVGANLASMRPLYVRWFGRNASTESSRNTPRFEIRSLKPYVSLSGKKSGNHSKNSGGPSKLSSNSDTLFSSMSGRDDSWIELEEGLPVHDTADKTRTKVQVRDRSR